ncbi:MAG: adenosylcobalamin-dependent ribonucleoside-diphosphate reductase [Elusimicrobia bacterium]|nr:adenosylcobalamin-dependent ribonucleoside-diphosphate reductase [Elusimicrobiota bacterium]
MIQQVTSVTGLKTEQNNQAQGGAQTADSAKGQTTMFDKIRSKRRAVSSEGIALTDNQLKVIRDKYLRDSKSVEEWLRGVAHNIALAELFYHPKFEEWKALEGVSCRTAEFAAKGEMKSRAWFFHNGLQQAGERDKNFNRLTANLSRIANEVPEARELVSTWEERFYETMSHFEFLPNSPTLMNAGRELQQLSACYVLPVPDSMEGITYALQAQALIQKSGGGTGFSFGKLRPSGDMVKTTKGIASGAISFMQMFDKMTDVVKQGGTRRGANMGILPYWHPEIKNFIMLKSKPGAMENFNISVAVDAQFMKAAREDKEYDLLNPRTKEVVGKARAKEIFDLIIECAWKTGDPGLFIIDRTNESASNPVPSKFSIESTNPCGEKPLYPWEPCNLGSINLARFVKGPLGHGEVDWDRLEKTVQLSIRFLDNVIDVNNYPLPEIEEMAKSLRRIGLGVMGWSEMLGGLGVSYASDEAVEMGRQLMAFINEKSCEASCELAKERGLFPLWAESIYNPHSLTYRGKEEQARNCVRTTIAPTGTISIASGLQGSGIEPFFAIAYTRYNAKALEALRKGSNPDPNDVFLEVNPLFAQVARQNDYFGMSKDELFRKIDANHRSARGIHEIPQDIQELFVSAHDVPLEYHVRMQAAFQEHTDDAVSKTINMPNKATPDDVRRAYFMAYDLGCKGITIYRDGCKADQVLNLSPLEAKKRTARKDFGVSSEYFVVKTGYGTLHIHINYDDDGPFQVFLNLPPLGTEISGLTSILGILLSKYLEAGGDPVRILKHLNSVKGDRPFGMGDNRIDSIPHAVAVAFKAHLKKTGKLSDPGATSGKFLQAAVSPREVPAGGDSIESLELWEVAKAIYCPKCFSPSVSYESGCKGPTCHECGYSDCS